MDEQREQKFASREELIASLILDDFKKLSVKQFQWAQEAQQSRAQERALVRVRGALKDELKNVASAMTRAPYVYTSPSIRLMNGLEVRFNSLLKVQTNDVYKRLDAFMNTPEAPNNLRSADFINQALLAHALAQVNGEDFGGVRFVADEYHDLHKRDSMQAEAMLRAVFEARMPAVENLGSHIYQRLVEGYHAFQTVLDNLSEDEEMEQVLGN